MFMPITIQIKNQGEKSQYVTYLVCSFNQSKSESNQGNITQRSNGSHSAKIIDFDTD